MAAASSVPVIGLCLLQKHLITILLMRFLEKSRLDVCVHSTILTQKGTSVLCVYVCVFLIVYEDQIWKLMLGHANSKVVTSSQRPIVFSLYCEVFHGAEGIYSHVHGVYSHTFQNVIVMG